jgi:hypothetical protein
MGTMTSEEFTYWMAFYEVENDQQQTALKKATKHGKNRPR